MKKYVIIILSLITSKAYALDCGISYNYTPAKYVPTELELALCQDLILFSDMTDEAIEQAKAFEKENDRLELEILKLKTNLKRLKLRSARR